MNARYFQALTPSSIYRKIEGEADVFYIVQEVKSQAIALGMSGFEAGLLSMSVSELATNAIRYAKNGEVIIKKTDNGKGLEIQVNDEGEGIKNLHMALSDGYSSQVSLGLGLGAAKRGVDQMIIDSSPRGTSITLNKFLPVPREDIDVGMVSFPHIGEHVNGDAYVVKNYDGDKMLLAVFDGAGHGIKAQTASEVVLDFFKENYRLPLQDLLYASHKKLQKSNETRAVEAALLRITSDYIETVILGNLKIHADFSACSSVAAQSGSLGLAIPDSIQVQYFDRPKKFRFIMHSDGIETIDSTCLSLLHSQSPQKAAEQIFNTFALANDDATVVVVQS